MDRFLYIVCLWNLTIWVTFKGKTDTHDMTHIYVAIIYLCMHAHYFSLQQYWNSYINKNKCVEVINNIEIHTEIRNYFFCPHFELHITNSKNRHSPLIHLSCKSVTICTNLDRLINFQHWDKHCTTHLLTTNRSCF